METTRRVTVLDSRIRIIDAFRVIQRYHPRIPATARFSFTEVSAIRGENLKTVSKKFELQKIGEVWKIFWLLRNVWAIILSTCGGIQSIEKYEPNLETKRHAIASRLESG